MPFLTDHLVVDGVRLAYRDRGSGEPVVFLHGTPSHSYEWRDVVPASRPTAIASSRTTCWATASPNAPPTGTPRSPLRPACSGTSSTPLASTG
ncbi:hypothetical protein ACFQV4_28045 [Streptomyces thermocarboxydus]